MGNRRIKIRKGISILLSIFMLTGLMTTMPVTAGTTFTDASSIKHSLAVQELVNNGIINGYPDGTFRPQGTLTRAEACTILTRLMGGNGTSQASFKDVSSDHWATGYIAYCASQGIVAGYGDGKFGPDDKLTGSAWSKMLLAASGYDAVATGMVGDNWSRGVSSLADKEELYEDISGNFNPSSAVSRDNSCQMVHNAVYRDKRAAEEGNVVSSAMMDKLSYRFANTTEGFGYPALYNIPIERFYLMFGENEKAYELWWTNRFWQGNCFGISGTTEMFYDKNDISISSFRSGATAPKDLSLSDRNASWGLTLSEYIEAVQIAQFEVSVSKKVVETNVDQLSVICSQVESFAIGQSEPVVINVFAGMAGQSAGHALVGYDLKSVSNSESRLMVYDCNYPNDASRYITISKNSSGQYTGWEYPVTDSVVWGSSHNNGSISWISISDVYQIWKNSERNLHSDMMLLTVNKDATIVDAAGNLIAEIKNGVLIGYQPDVFPVSNLDMKNNGSVAFWVPVKTLSVRESDGASDIANLKVTLTHVDQAAEIVTEASELTVNVDDDTKTRTVEIDKSQAGSDYEITLRSTLPDYYEQKEIILKGNVQDENLRFGKKDGDEVMEGVDIESGELIVDGVSVTPYLPNAFSVNSARAYGTVPILVGYSDVDYVADQILSEIPTEGKSTRDQIQAVYDWIIYNCQRNDWDGNYYYDEEAVEAIAPFYGSAVEQRIKQGRAVIREEMKDYWQQELSGFSEDFDFDANYSVAYQAGDMMLKRTGDCVHYSALLTVLLGHLGYDSRMISGQFINSDGTKVSHKWNYVLIDGKYYWLDVRMDHSSYVRRGYIPHSYFIIEDTATWEKTHDWDHTYSDLLHAYPDKVINRYNEKIKSAMGS